MYVMFATVTDSLLLLKNASSMWLMLCKPDLQFPFYILFKLLLLSLTWLPLITDCCTAMGSYLITSIYSATLMRMANEDDVGTSHVAE